MKKFFIDHVDPIICVSVAVLFLNVTFGAAYVILGAGQ